MLAALIIAALFPWLYAADEAGADASRIAADKPINHAAGFLRRGAWALAFTAWMWWLFGWLVGLAYLAYFAGVFGHKFQSGLNLARGLEKWHVSRETKEKGSATTDRLLVRLAPKFGLAPEELACHIYNSARTAGIVIFLLVIIYCFTNDKF